ncbi:MAG: DUF2007 domain-containing protein [Bdellovibrionales bacterium]|nr:DUF2007 domain-containing protein [Bdellovibrionales bacterium]
MANRKVIARLDSVIEAQAIQSILEGADIQCFIDNANISNILPHETQAFGGVTVSVWDEDEERAKNLLAGELETIVEGADQMPEPETTDDKKNGEFRKHMKRAVAGAVIGSMLVPVISNFYSIHHLRKAYLIDSKQFFQRKGTIFFSMIFNLAIAWGVIAIILELRLQR